MRRILLTHNRAPGDTCVLTALVRDIAITRPGEFQIAVNTSAMDLWQHNPYIVPLSQLKAGGPHETVKIQYGQGIRDQNFEPVHFVSYFHRDFARQCGVTVPLTQPFPDVHLSAEEQQPLINKRYWVVLSGGKSDFTAKIWRFKQMQQVVDELIRQGIGVVQIGSTSKGHSHPPLEGALNLVGKTNLRDMLRLIQQSDGVVCGVTCAMHMAAALQRPCVVLAGGREAWWWEAYVRQNKGLPGAENLRMPHKFLHTIGLLDCCRIHGCWKNKVVKLNNDNSVCKKVVTYTDQSLPRCMDMITSQHVLDAIMQYYTDNSLPPIETPTELIQVPQLAGPPPQAVTPPAAKTITAGKPGPGMTKHTASVKIPPQMMAQLAAGKLQGRPGLQAAQPARNIVKTCAPKPPAKRAAAPASGHIPDSVYDHGDVGGRFTVFVLLYGDYFDMHKRCLNAILSTTPRDRIDLRVGSNQLCEKSLQLVENFVAQGVIRKHYRHVDNAYKYPVMREMFYDAECPVTTKWIIWFDDDSIADVEPQWLKILASTIADTHAKTNAHMYGAIFSNEPGTQRLNVFKSRPWYHGRPWRLHNGQPAPNGNKVLFAAGGWWAATYEAVQKCDIPDLQTGLTHNGGDIQIGEQLYQGGFGLKSFNSDKRIVNTSSVARRGVTIPPAVPKNMSHVPENHAIPRKITITEVA